VSKASLIIILCSALALPACSPAVVETAKATPRTVLVSRAEAPTNPADMVVGTVRSAQMHVVSSEQGGRVVALLADVGDRVTAGQVMARLDTTPLDLRVSAATSETARAAATAAERSRHAERMRQLVADGTASPAELDAALAEEATARAALQLADVQASQARRDRMLALVRAPANGVVAARPAMLSAMLAPGAPVFEIETHGDRLVSAAVPAAAAARLQPGTPVTFRSAGATGQARLIAISARDNGAGGREARFAIVGGAPAPGATVELMLPGGALSASASVPVSAVLEGRDGSQSVRVVGAGNRLRDVPVRFLGLAGANALVRGRLAAGDLVVAAGGEFLEAGFVVRPHLAAR
jgi:RND family efflux transporter MFP subunit